MSITQTLVDFALSDLRPSDRARQIVALSAVDWAACGIAGFEDGMFTPWARQQAVLGDTKTFAGIEMAGPAAALVNGTLSHALDYDDTHFAHIGHPSVVVLPALLAGRPLDWQAFEDAALVGIEASIQIGMWLGRGHYARGFHMTATAGALGACVGLIRLQALSPQQARAALGLCATMASGLRAQFGTMGKPLNAGLAARAAVEAVAWAQGGLTGPEMGVEAFATAHEAACDAGALDLLGADWRLDTLSHKFHACCHGLHAALEALRGYDAALPDKVELRTHSRWMDVCNIAAPDTGLAAKFSYAHVVAMALSGHDTGDIAMFTDERARDPDLTRLRARVHVVADDSLTETQARLTLLVGADSQIKDHDLAHPMALLNLSDRVQHKAATLIGGDRAGAIWGATRQSDLVAFTRAVFG